MYEQVYAGFFFILFQHILYGFVVILVELGTSFLKRLCPKKKYLNENKTSKSFFGAMYLISVTMADCHTQPCKNASISDDNSVRFSFVS